MRTPGWALGLLTVALVMGGVWSGVGWLVRLPPQATVQQPTLRLYAGTEEIALLQGLGHRAQVWRPLPDFPRAVVDAVLVAEDRRFFQHRGIDVVAVLRAVATNVRRGEIRQGASTITQQLARTLFLTPERGWGRKLHEAGLALLLEFRYSKPRILEAYLNTIYMGHDQGIAVHGLPAAARNFLGKDLAALAAGDAALLAGAISSPNKTLGGLTDRARTVRAGVLSEMQRRGLLDEERAQEAKAEPLPAETNRARLRAPYFVDVVREEIGRRLAADYAGEVRIMTSLDPELQRAAERAVQEGVAKIEKRHGRARQQARIEAALVAIEPASGQIRALVGGRRYLDSPFNRATRALRQPGSLFKPVVYLAAFEFGARGGTSQITPASLIPDAPLTVRTEGRPWAPRNEDGRLLGNVTVRRAVEESRNIPTVRVALDVGLERIADVAQRVGIESPLATVPSLALGTSEVTLLEITGVYATLANQGIRSAPTALADNGHGEAHLAPVPPPVRAVSAEGAFLMTHLLRGVMRQGTGKTSSRWGLSETTAGKTGTTDGLRDAWFVGYTPDLVIGVWVGRDDGSALGLSGAEAALPIWAATMSTAVRRTAPRPFTAPPGIVLVSVNRDTGKSASFWCDQGLTVEEAFRAGTEPPEGCGGAALAGAGRRILNWFTGLFR